MQFYPELLFIFFLPLPPLFSFFLSSRSRTRRACVTYAENVQIKPLWMKRVRRGFAPICTVRRLKRARSKQGDTCNDRCFSFDSMRPLVVRANVHVFVKEFSNNITNFIQICVSIFFFDTGHSIFSLELNLWGCNATYKVHWDWVNSIFNIFARFRARLDWNIRMQFSNKFHQLWNARNIACSFLFPKLLVEDLRPRQVPLFSIFFATYSNPSLLVGRRFNRIDFSSSPF